MTGVAIFFFFFFFFPRRPAHGTTGNVLVLLRLLGCHCPVFPPYFFFFLCLCSHSSPGILSCYNRSLRSISPSWTRLPSFHPSSPPDYIACSIQRAACIAGASCSEHYSNKLCRLESSSRSSFFVSLLILFGSKELLRHSRQSVIQTSTITTDDNDNDITAKNGKQEQKEKKASLHSLATT